MKSYKSIIAICTVVAFTYVCAFCSSPTDEPSTPVPSTGQTTPDTPSTPDVPTSEFRLTGSMVPDASLVGQDYKAIHSYMRQYGWDYSEHPNSSEKDHFDGVHCQVVYDPELDLYVFRFINHANADVLDGDRGSIVDRQRNEMKSQTAEKWAHLNGNLGERQRLQWKFRLPAGFQPSSSFCHIHQLKAQEGNNGAPLITITPRSDKDGGNKRVQVIHTGDTKESTLGTIIDNLPFSDFEGEWIQVTTEMLYGHDGEFSIRMERVRDGKVIVDKRFTGVDLWRTGATNIRNKFGIYRSYGRKMESADDRPDNGIKDEIIDITDFKVYEANSLTNM